MDSKTPLDWIAAFNGIAAFKKWHDAALASLAAKDERIEFLERIIRRHVAWGNPQDENIKERWAQLQLPCALEESTSESVSESQEGDSVGDGFSLEACKQDLGGYLEACNGDLEQALEDLELVRIQMDAANNQLEAMQKIANEIQNELQQLKKEGLI
jgi:hypothetical protein